MGRRAALADADRGGVGGRDGRGIRVSGQARPSLRVIVLRFRNAAATVRCLESLEAAIYPGPLDVVVLENGSGDDSWSVLSAYERRTRLSLRLLRGEVNLGFAGGMNRAW